MGKQTIFLENSKELWDSLRELDRMPERSQIEVNCFYINHLYQIDLNISLVDEKNYREYSVISFFKIKSLDKLMIILGIHRIDFLFIR